MSKGRRIRAQRRAAYGPRGRLLRTIEDIDAAGDLLMTDMPCRTCYITDPVLGGVRPATGVGPGGELLTDETGTVEPLPVVLFEPASSVMLKNLQTGTVQEAKLEAVVAHGFHRTPRSGGAWVVQPALGWEVRRIPDGLALRDATGTVWARSEVRLDPAWVSAATSYRHVAVFYGPQLGVRTPPGMDSAAYTTAKRAAEYRQARDQGLVAAATVEWHGEPAGETLEWVTFLPGSFGQPFAAVFAPISEFSRHGGPEGFGLCQLRDQGMAVRADPVRTLAVRVSRTDIDLLDPGEDAMHAQLGGVHYPEGVQPAWRQAALSQGRVLAVTGRRLPGYPGDALPDNGDLADLWAAIAPVHAV